MNIRHAAIGEPRSGISQQCGYEHTGAGRRRQGQRIPGSYDDWLRQRQSEAPPAEPVPAKAKPPRLSKQRPRRLTYQEQRELESLPEQIVALETKLNELHQMMADPAFYRREPAEIVKAKTQLQSLEKEIAEVYQRWEDFEKAAGVVCGE